MQSVSFQAAVYEAETSQCYTNSLAYGTVDAQTV